MWLATIELEFDHPRLPVLLHILHHFLITLQKKADRGREEGVGRSVEMASLDNEVSKEWVAWCVRGEGTTSCVGGEERRELVV